MRVAGTLPVLDLGLVPYEEVQALQGKLRRRVAAGETPDVLLLLEHPAVITLGSRGRRADVPALPAAGEAVERGATVIPVVRSERGGAATLHAPGQLISYPIMTIPGRDLRRYVRSLEEVLVRLLAGYGISATRRPDAPGLYVDDRDRPAHRVPTQGGPPWDDGSRPAGSGRDVSADEVLSAISIRGAKIASVGLRCERWVASHGTSLNVSVDLSLFDLIVSCGEIGLRQASMEVLIGGSIPMAGVKEAYVSAFGDVFGRVVDAPRQTSVHGAEVFLGDRAPNGC